MNRRGPVGLLVGVELPAGDPMLAEEDPVVGVEDEHGVAELTEALELAEDAAHGVVDLQQGGEATSIDPSVRSADVPLASALAGFEGRRACR